MLSHSLFLALPACLGAGSMLALAIVSSFSSVRPAARAFTIYCLAVFVWCFGAAAEQFAPSLAERIVWAKLEHVGIVWIGPAWFAFCGFYTATLRRSSWRLWPLALIPLTSLFLVWANEQHGLIWSDIHWNGVAADFSHGWWFTYVYLPYGYLLIALGNSRLLQRWLDASVSYRKSIFFSCSARLYRSFPTCSI